MDAGCFVWASSTKSRLGKIERSTKMASTRMGRRRYRRMSFYGIQCSKTRRTIAYFYRYRRIYFYGATTGSPKWYWRTTRSMESKRVRWYSLLAKWHLLVARQEWKNGSNRKAEAFPGNGFLLMKFIQCYKEMKISKYHSICILVMVSPYEAKWINGGNGWMYHAKSLLVEMGKHFISPVFVPPVKMVYLGETECIQYSKFHPIQLNHRHMIYLGYKKRKKRC